MAEQTMSRQRRWQLKKLAEGKCAQCGRDLATSVTCLDCAVKRRERMRKIRKSNMRYNALTYRLQKAQV